MRKLWLLLMSIAIVLTMATVNAQETGDVTRTGINGDLIGGLKWEVLNRGSAVMIIEQDTEKVGLITPIITYSDWAQFDVGVTIPAGTFEEVSETDAEDCELFLGVSVKLDSLYDKYVLDKKDTDVGVVDFIVGGGYNIENQEPMLYLGWQFRLFGG